MCSEAVPFFVVMAQLCQDIAEQKVPQHVAALILKSVHAKTPMPLEDISPRDWVTVSQSDGNEAFLALKDLFDDVAQKRLSISEAAEFISAIHGHLDVARDRIKSMQVAELGMSIEATSFCMTHSLNTVQQILERRLSGLSSLVEQGSYVVLQEIIVRLQTLPLCPRFM